MSGCCGGKETSEAYVSADVVSVCAQMCVLLPHPTGASISHMPSSQAPQILDVPYTRYGTSLDRVALWNRGFGEGGSKATEA